MGYWIYKEKRYHGPYDLDTLDQMLSSGQIVAKTLVKNEKEELSDVGRTLGFHKDSRDVPTEYRRTCRNCGRLWHSLVAREKEVESKEIGEGLMQGATGMAGCGTCGLTLGAASQHSRNREMHHSELQRLRTCPQCGSANYDQQIILFDNRN